MRVKHERDIVSCLREQGFSGQFMFSGRTIHHENGKVEKSYTATYSSTKRGIVVYVGESTVNLEDAINNLREKLNNVEQ